MRRLVLLAVFFPSVALAAGPLTAKLVQPLGSAKDLIVAETMWHCEGSTCVTRSNAQKAGTIPACHELVGQVGAVSAYGSADHAFDADSLASCNAQ